jgi:DNA-binding MarR family transcriptional regulator
VVRLSKNQKKILEILEIKPDMTTKEIAETVFGKLVEYKTKEYSSAMRSLASLEKQGLIERVQVQLRWRRKPKTRKALASETR